MSSDIVSDTFIVLFCIFKVLKSLNISDQLSLACRLAPRLIISIKNKLSQPGDFMLS